MAEEEELRLVLAPVNGDRTGVGMVPGSVTITASCGHECWLSPSGMGALLATPTTTICIDCLPPGEKKLLGEGVVPGAREELERTVGRPLANKLIDTALRHIRKGGTLP